MGPISHLPRPNKHAFPAYHSPQTPLKTLVSGQAQAHHPSRVSTQPWHPTAHDSPARARKPMAKNTRRFRFRHASRGDPPIGQPRPAPSAPNPESGQQSTPSYPIPIVKGRRPQIIRLYLPSLPERRRLRFPRRKSTAFLPVSPAVAQAVGFRGGR
jgi:hypothetical protein